MEITLLMSRSLPRGLGALQCFLLLCLLTSLPAVAEENQSCKGADMAGYATLAFCLPADVAVLPEALAEGNYTEGREVKALLILNESRVFLHLLFPCRMPSANMEPAELRSRIEAFDPSLKEMTYNTAPLNISGRQALWGGDANRTFAFFQPSNQTLALVLMDENLTEKVRMSLLGSLQITVSQNNSPLLPGYCAEPEAAAANAENNTNAYYQYHPTERGGDVEARLARFEAAKEQMAAESEATKERLDAAKERLMEIEGPKRPLFQY